MDDLAGNTTSVAERAPARFAGAAIALCGVQFIDVLGVTVVITALPRMLVDLGATTAQGTVVVTAYALFFGGLMMVASRVGDRIGHRRCLLAALALFAAASVLGALAESVWVLAVARALQGTAAATSVPAALRLLTTVVPDGPARRRAVAGWSAAGAAAGASGFVVGGVLTELASWRAVFWMNLALAALLSGAIVRLIARDQPRAAAARIGWLSGILLSGGAMGIVAGTTLLAEQESAVPAGALTTVGVVAISGFVLADRRSDHPLVAPAARRSPGLRWGAFGSFVNTATTSSSVTVATLFLQDDLGLAPLRASGLLVTFSILVVLGSLCVPRLIAVLGGGRSLGCGLAIVAVGNTLLAAWPSVAGVAVGAGACGLGIGIGSVAATDMGTAVGEAIRSTAAGVLNTAAQLGTAIGTAVILLVATAFQPRVAWAVAAILAGVAAVTAAARARRAEPRLQRLGAGGQATAGDPSQRPQRCHLRRRGLLEIRPVDRIEDCASALEQKHDPDGLALLPDVHLECDDRVVGDR
jgi:MFS family permease